GKALRKTVPAFVVGAAALYALGAQAQTAEQATAGRTAYTQYCAACHGADLRLLPNARLAGPEFMARWQGRSTGELLQQLRATMPPEGQNTLAEAVYVDIIAYLLDANGQGGAAQPVT